MCSRLLVLAAIPVLLVSVGCDFESLFVDLDDRYVGREYEDCYTCDTYVVETWYEEPGVLLRRVRLVLR